MSPLARQPVRAVLRTSTMLTLVAVLVACSTTPTGPTTAATPVGGPPGGGTTEPAPRVPAVDDRDYRALTLDNGMQVLVVSDPTTDQAAAALAVDVGSFDEDRERLGLAHFLEHMLFLGTEKYPDPDEYGEYISARGGSRNAYTALDHTNYFFSIAAPEFEGGLDRFAQFFVAPLFTAEFVDREKNAVDSEYQMQLRDDGWRTYMTQKRAINPDHPGSRFTIGSLATLADDGGRSVREDLLAFYAEHYTAEGMALVLLGREDVDTLARWARRYFSAVPRRAGSVASATDVPVFDPESLPSLMHIRPVKERRVLELAFALPASDPVYRIDPGSYLSNLIGHEGAGSLHARLRELGWIDSLAAGAQRFGDEASLLSITADLTESGFAHWQEVGEKIFAYVELLRAGGIDAERFAEQAMLARLSFRFQEKGDAFGYVRRLASNMLVYPTEDVIRGGRSMDTYDGEVIAAFLDGIRPELAQVTLTAPEVETDQVEPWFDVPYAIGPLDDAVLKRWQRSPADAQLALPAANPFVPENLELLADGAEQPQQLPGPGGIELWHLRETDFGTPRASVRVELRTEAAGTTPEDTVHASLYASLVTDALNEYAYPARLAGLGFGLSSGGNGLQLTLGGFDDRIGVLLDRVAQTMGTLDVDPERFAHFRTELRRSLRNARQNRPYQQAIAELRRILEDPAHELEALEAAAEAASVEGLENWMTRALAQPGVRMLAVGNLDATRARELAETLASALGLEARGELLGRALVRLGEADRTQREVSIEHADAAYTLYVQGRDQSWAERARFGLAAHLMSAPYFNSLRTDQQLGYVVTAAPWVRVSTPGVIFLVQSPAAPAEHIETATFEFLDRFASDLASMSETEYAEQRAGLLSRVLEADKNLVERSGRLWGDLVAGIDTFDARERVAEAIEATSLADMQAFLETFVDLARARRVTVWSQGRFADAGAPTGDALGTLDAFKASRGRFTSTAPTQELRAGAR